MARKKPPHITVFRPKNGSGVEEFCSQLVSHAKATGHGIDDLVAEFVGHFLDQKHLLEHGSSIYGSWLTERGKQFVEIGPHSTKEGSQDA